MFTMVHFKYGQSQDANTRETEAESALAGKENSKEIRQAVGESVQ